MRNREKFILRKPMIKNIIYPIFVLLSILQITVQSQSVKPDLIIVNANVRTMDKTVPRAEAIAVAGNKILAVGSSKKIRALASAKTKTIDAGGRLVLPGFNDSHVHFMSIGNQFFSLDLRDAKSPPEIAERVRYYVRFLPDGVWILGSGWNQEKWMPNDLPTKELIDAAAPDNPVFLYHTDPTMALANSRALKLAGIDKNRKDFQNTVLRDEEGEPTGILKNSAVSYVRTFTPKLSTANLSAAAETASNYAASLGITSVQDVHSDDNFDVFNNLARQGKLKTRVYDCIALFDWLRLEKAAIKKVNGDAMVRRGCLKGFSDGDADAIPGLYKNVLAADKADLQVMIHAIGSRANDAVLTIFERVIKENGVRDRRFRIEHAHPVRQEDFKRFGEANIIPSMQPYLFSGGFGSNSPYRAMLDAKAIPAFGSDASITEFNPLYGIYAAAGGANHESENVFTVEQAVRAYTLGSAYGEFQENVKGSITAGKLADLIVLSEDIFSISPEAIRETKVLTTIVDGKIVFEAK